MASSDEVIEKGEIEATKVKLLSHTWGQGYCFDNLSQITYHPQENEKDKEENGEDKDNCNTCKSDQEVVFIQVCLNDF